MEPLRDNVEKLIEELTISDDVMLKRDCLIEGDLPITNNLVHTTINRWIDLIISDLHIPLVGTGFLTLLGLHIRIDDILTILEKSVQYKDRVILYQLRVKVNEISQMNSIVLCLNRLDGVRLSMCEIVGSTQYFDRLSAFVKMISYSTVKSNGKMIEFISYEIHNDITCEQRYEWMTVGGDPRALEGALIYHQDYAIDDNVTVRDVASHLISQFNNNKCVNVVLKDDRMSNGRVIFGIRFDGLNLIISHSGLYRAISLSIFLANGYQLNGKINLMEYLDVHIRSDVMRAGLTRSAELLRNIYPELNGSYYGDGSLNKRKDMYVKDGIGNDIEINEFLSYVWIGEWRVIRDIFWPVKCGRVLVDSNSVLTTIPLWEVTEMSSEKVIGGRTIRDNCPVFINGEGKIGRLEAAFNIKNKRKEWVNGEKKFNHQTKKDIEIIVDRFITRDRVENGIIGVHRLNTETFLLIEYLFNEYHEVFRIIGRVINDEKLSGNNSIVTNIVNGKVINIQVSGLYLSALCPKYVGTCLNIYENTVGMTTEIPNCNFSEVERFSGDMATYKFDTSIVSILSYELSHDVSIFERCCTFSNERKRFLGLINEASINSTKSDFNRTGYINGYAKPEVINRYAINLIHREDENLPIKKSQRDFLDVTKELYPFTNSFEFWSPQEIYSILPLFTGTQTNLGTKLEKCFRCKLQYQLPILCQLCRDV